MTDDRVWNVLVALMIVVGIICTAGIVGSIHEETHPKYSMQVVTTGDVTWACLNRNGKTVGCDTVEAYK